MKPRKQVDFAAGRLGDGAGRGDGAESRRSAYRASRLGIRPGEDSESPAPPAPAPAASASRTAAPGAPAAKPNAWEEIAAREMARTTPAPPRGREGETQVWTNAAPRSAAGRLWDACRRRPLPAALAAGVILGVIVWGAWSYLAGSTGSPQSASAADHAPPPQPAPARVASPADRHWQEHGVQPAGEKGPPPRGAARRPPDRPPAPQDAPEADRFRPPEIPAHLRPPAKPAPKPAPSPGAAPSKRDPRYVPCPDGYHLTGIVQQPTGLEANVNGVFVGVGETIDDAKVIDITTDGVEMELNGDRFVVRLGSQPTPPAREEAPPGSAGRNEPPASSDEEQDDGPPALPSGGHVP
jgi:hypothetical protein